jgi:hypothetical protein
MKSLNLYHKQDFLVKESRLMHFLRRLTRKYHLKRLAGNMRINAKIPPYPYYG